MSLKAAAGAVPSPAPAQVPYNDWRAVAVPDAAAFTPALPVSVIVPCYQAPQALALTLAGLERQDWPAELLEVVVVDDGSEPPLERPEHNSLDLRVIRQPRDGFGLAQARNAGVLAAAHDILVFLDSDVIAEAGLIRAHARWHHAVVDALTVGFCNYVAPVGLDAAAVRERRGSLAELFAGRAFDPPWLERHMARTADLTSRHPDLFRAVTGHNFGISRVLFEAAGGFDESFDRYGGEDTEFAYRVQVHGGLLVPVRTALGWHQGRWSEGRRDKERDLDRQAGKLADLIAEPGFRPDAPARPFAVPRHVVTLSIGQAPAKQAVRAVEALLADPAGDLALCVNVPPGQRAVCARLKRRFARQPRVRVVESEAAPGKAVPAWAGLDAFPAAPIHIAVALSAVLGWSPAGSARRVALLGSALGDAAFARAILDDGTEVSAARAWALNRARRAGGRATDYGHTRTLPARWLCGEASPVRPPYRALRRHRKWLGPAWQRTGAAPRPARRRRPRVGGSPPCPGTAHRVAVHAVAGRRRPLAFARRAGLDGDAVAARKAHGEPAARGPAAGRLDRRAWAPFAGGVCRLHACPAHALRARARCDRGRYRGAGRRRALAMRAAERCAGAGGPGLRSRDAQPRRLGP